MWRSLASVTLNAVFIALIAMAGAIIWGQRSFVEPGPLREGICLEIPRGGAFSKVAGTLFEKGALSSETIFRLGYAYSGLKGQLKHGSFLIPEGASMKDIAQIITVGGRNTCGSELVYVVGISRMQIALRSVAPQTGKLEEQLRLDLPSEDMPAVLYQALEEEGMRHRVTFAEGITSWQVVEALSHIAALSGEISDLPLEGSLSPDSYEFRKGDQRQDIIARMQRRQSTILEDAWAARGSGAAVDSPQEALILASIIEKETGVASERGLVSGVFTNRLRKGIRLQTDPSVIYGLTLGQGSLGRGLRRSELRKSTPYNTYRIDGLPPTPIANPGKAAIEAALNPAQTDFLYFVADGTGAHVFAKTLREHNANVAKWRAQERK